MRLIFMGTPEFAVPTLQALIEAGHEIVGVYSQPDKEKGRGKKLEASAVKTYALSKGLPVFTPKGLKRESVIEEMRSLQADAIVVAAYGKILRENVLSMTRYGCFNVHASLLPKYRGAAPIEWAILDGEKETGVTIMQMNEGLDTGDMLYTVKCEILPEDTGDSLTEKLSVMGGPAMVEVLKLAEEGKLSPVSQPEESPTEYASMLEKAMGELDFTESAEKNWRKIRAFNSRPTAFTWLDGKNLRIFASSVTEGTDAVPGTVIAVNKKNFTVQCSEGALTILSVQLEGKKKMDSDAFLRGYQLKEGTVLGRNR